MTNPLTQPGTPFTLEMCNPSIGYRKESKSRGEAFLLTVEIHQEAWDEFRAADLAGMLIAAKACVAGMGEEEALETTKEPKGMYSDFANALHKHGFFLSPAVWAAVGTDKVFREAVQIQECCVCGGWADWLADIGEGRCHAAHVERVNSGSGTAIKSKYACIPLCGTCHKLQHDQGEFALWMQATGSQGGAIHQAKAWFDKQRIKYVSEWAKEQFKAHFEVDHLYDLDPKRVWLWVKDNPDVGVMMPRGF